VLCLEYYRATLGPVLKMPLVHSDAAGLPTTPINVPAMIMYGRNDGCIGAELIEGMAAHFPRGLKVEVVPDAGHFVHQERPEQVNRLILDFLRA
jgi:pimeloyl-ACP methyl ester carboxylesterase